MSKKISVLFVCSGNFFRSQIAEYYLKKYVREHKLDWLEVASAGTIARKLKDKFGAHKELRKDKVYLSQYRQKRLTKERLAKADFVVAMAQNHYDFILKKYKQTPFLFNELAIGKKTSVADLKEVMPDFHKHKEKALEYIDEVALYIEKKTPLLVKELSKRTKQKR
ncbi:MAG: hypothetical protein WC821_00740 [archaeon]|jgi:protein-tyrosine-phosphatase